MVGDIFGKSWGTTQPPSSASTIGIVNKNPNLFGDLVSSALGQGSKTSSTNVPLKNATSKVSSAPTSNKTSFSMGNMADSLPKTASTPQTTASWASSGTVSMNDTNKTPNLGGPSLRSTATGTSSVNNDPFSSLSGIGSKQSASLNSSAKGQKAAFGDDGFGDFKSASTAFPSTASPGIDFNFTGSAASNQTPPVQASGGGDPMDMFFAPASSASGGGGGGAAAAAPSDGFGGQDDWGLDSEFGGGGHDVGGATTELDGLPPPPAGVSGSTAKGKGMDNYKQGQFADAIKWFSWAVILLEKAGDSAATFEVLSCRASCYKEVGEYKKAVADCTKVLENDETNVAVLVQRALLYESMEKYRLGAEDLRIVLKIDPGNRIARSTVHRLAKMAE